MKKVLYEFFPFTHLTSKTIRYVPTQNKLYYLCFVVGLLVQVKNEDWAIFKLLLYQRYFSVVLVNISILVDEIFRGK